ncbi:major capsid protein [Viridibacillus sp. FSL R5-0468]|uniref:major capsid protein n=1 Tax=Viridibacillus sp. FSL R5-0468 TaxID=2921640 RepID=UPI0030F600C5
MSNINLFEPRSMLKVIERINQPTTFLRDTFFRNVDVQQTNTIDVDFKKNGRKVAPFVHEKIGGVVIENTGFKTETFTPQLIAPSKITSAADIATRSFGEGIYSSRTPAERAVEKLLRDFTELDATISRREEVMCSQALFGGKIEIINKDVNREINFHFTNDTALVGKDLWSDPSSKPYNDLKNEVRRVQMTGSINPNIVVMGSDVADVFLNHAQIKEYMNLRHMNMGEFTPNIIAPGVTYLGRLNGLNLDIYEYNEYYLDDFTNPSSPENKPLVPAGKVLIGSTEAQNTMAYAAITLLKETPDGKGMYETYEATRVPDQWIERNPSRQMIQVNSKPLPVPNEIDSWSVLQVL